MLAWRPRGTLPRRAQPSSRKHFGELPWGVGCRRPAGPGGPGAVPDTRVLGGREEAAEEEVDSGCLNGALFKSSVLERKMLPLGEEAEASEAACALMHTLTCAHKLTHTPALPPRTPGSVHSACPDRACFGVQRFPGLLPGCAWLGGRGWGRETVRRPRPRVPETSRDSWGQGRRARRLAA